MKASDYIAQFIAAQEITHVFEMAGGMITHLLDSIRGLGKTQIVSMHHEQACAFAVDAYGRTRKRASFAFATSGPGATNLLTGIGSCYFDSSPGIFITGQVNVHEQKGNKLVRQLGFQETDIVAMAKPIVKAAYSITSANQLPDILEKSYRLAINGRPGPVLIDIPMNCQSQQIEAPTPCYIERAPVNNTVDPYTLAKLADALKTAARPLILAGRGVCAGETTSFKKLVESLQIPVVTSLLALDCLPFQHPERLGFIGSYGNRWANMALGNADVLLVIGSRLDIRQTGADVQSFAKGKQIFHVDCEPGEINNRVTGCTAIHADAADFCKQFHAYAKPVSCSEWLDQLNAWEIDFPDTSELDVPGINPNWLMHELAASSACTAGYSVDVGLHQMWAAQSLEITENQYFLTSAGMGAMGFSLPAAIGASLSCNRAPFVVVVGDGSMQLNIQELQTIARNNLPIKIVVLNNQSLGMIRQFQDSYFDSRYQSTVDGYSAPNFSKIAEAYGIDTLSIKSDFECSNALEALWANTHKPFLLEVHISQTANAYPKIAFGKPITEMEPFAKPVGMEST